MAKKLVHPPVTRKQLILIAGIVLLGLFCFGYTSRLIASSELKAEVAFWEAEVQMEEERLRQNQQQLEYVKSDQYVIDKAHTELGWTFPNEVLVWLEGSDRPQMEATEFPAEAAPFWQQWRQRFLGDRASQKLVE